MSLESDESMMRNVFHYLEFTAVLVISSNMSTSSMGGCTGYSAHPQPAAGVV